jgi:hypothetical protein
MSTALTPEPDYQGLLRNNVMMMKAAYLSFPKVQTASGQLSWSHREELRRELELTLAEAEHRPGDSPAPSDP